MKIPTYSLRPSLNITLTAVHRHNLHPTFTFTFMLEMLPTPLFLPGESCGQRSLVGYSSWGRKESDTTEATELAHMLSSWDVAVVISKKTKYG